MEFYDGNIDFAEEAPALNMVLIPCSTCSRTFNEKALSKHAPICRKASKNAARRGQFDSAVQRAPEGELKVNRGSKNATPQKKIPEAKKEKPAWKIKHEQFVKNIRAARHIQKIVQEGGDISQLPPPPPDENPDYVQCQYCTRRFNQDAAKRHIPFCETQHKRSMMKKPAKETPKSDATNRRINYKPPSFKKKPHSAISTKANELPSQPQTPRPPTSMQKTSMTSTTRKSRHAASSARKQRESPPIDHSFQREATMNSMAYPFDREREAPDESFLEQTIRRHRGERNGSASSVTSGKSMRIGSATRPKFCGCCGESLNYTPKKFCMECGEKFLDSRGKFCPHCGTRRQS
eukprot:m.15299 g.15299  ORF g.15299 m.15299 type:complete len:349 (+) comp4452_c0_seq1:156-1202(+)